MIVFAKSAVVGQQCLSNVYISVVNDRITCISTERPADLDDAVVITSDLVAPGFVDIHTHGLGGRCCDIANTWHDPTQTQRLLARTGTTSFLASLVFGGMLAADMQATVAQVQSIVGVPLPTAPAGAICEGIHAEGPVIADLGGLPAKIEMPLAEFSAFVDSLAPALRMMTIAPSVDARLDFVRIRHLVARGVLPALGHDRDATEAHVLGALRAAAPTRLHITHIFNVCSFHHRLPSLVNFGLTETFPALSKFAGLVPPTVEIIGDMEHVHPLSVQLVLAARQHKHVAFITDNIMEYSPGLQGTYAGRAVRVPTDERKVVVLDGSDTICGSCASLLDTFQSLVRVFGLSIVGASTLVSANAAAIVGLDRGVLAVGKMADMVLLTAGLEWQGTVVRGQLVR